MVALGVSAVLGFTSAGGTQALAGSAPLAAPGVAADAPFTPTVRYLLKQLTVDEKIQLIHGSLGEGIVTPATPTDPGANGAIGVVFGVPRLGIPTIRHADSNGINVFADSTAYPGRLGLAASFDRAGASQFGRQGDPEHRIAPPGQAFRLLQRSGPGHALRDR